MIIVSLFLALGGGLCMAFQSPTNSTLSKYIGNLQATTLNFALGAAVLAVFILAFGSGDFVLIGTASWWMIMGGVYGVCIVLIITYAAPLLGIALTLTIIMLGQLIMGTIIDGLGLFCTDVVPIRPLRIISCLSVAAGVFIVYMGRKSPDNKHHVEKKSIAVGTLAFFAGVGGAIQSPSNVALANIIGKLESSFMNFAVGFVLIFIVTLIASRGKFPKVKRIGLRGWMLTGGFYGAAGIFINVITTPYLGVTLLIATLMFGQLGGGMLVDSFGLLRAEKVAMNGRRYFGMSFIFAGVIMFTAAKMMI